MLILILTNIVLPGWIWSFSVAFFAKSPPGPVCTWRIIGPSLWMFCCNFVWDYSRSHRSCKLRRRIARLICSVLKLRIWQFLFTSFWANFCVSSPEIQGNLAANFNQRNNVNYIQCCHGNLFITSFSPVITLFSVFMWRSRIPKLKATFPSEVLVASDRRSYGNLTFDNVLARQGSSFCYRARLNSQAWTSKEERSLYFLLTKSCLHWKKHLFQCARTCFDFAVEYSRSHKKQETCFWLRCWPSMARNARKVMWQGKTMLIHMHKPQSSGAHIITHFDRDDVVMRAIE